VSLCGFARGAFSRDEIRQDRGVVNETMRSGSRWQQVRISVKIRRARLPEGGQCHVTGAHYCSAGTQKIYLETEGLRREQGGQRAALLSDVSVR